MLVCFKYYCEIPDVNESNFRGIVSVPACARARARVQQLVQPWCTILSLSLSARMRAGATRRRPSELIIIERERTGVGWGARYRFV